MTKDRGNCLCLSGSRWVISAGGRGWLHLEPAQSANTIATCQSCYTLVHTRRRHPCVFWGPPTLAAAGHFWGYLMLVAFSVTPLGAGEGVGEIVAEAVRVVRESGLPNQTDAMFTTIEGDWDETMAVVKRAVDAVAARAPRVSLVLKADLRPGVTDALTSKVETVERYLRSDG